MKKYQDFILESFDTKPARWTLDRDNDSVIWYSFEIDGKTYHVEFEYYAGLIGEYDLVFDGENEYGHSSCSMTGGGNQYKVFVTVIDCIRDLVKRKENTDRPVNKLEFSASTFSHCNRSTISARPSVYARLIKKFLPKGYKVETREISSYVNFHIEKKDITESLNESLTESFDTKPLEWEELSREGHYWFTTEKHDYEIFITPDIHTSNKYAVAFKTLNPPPGISAYGIIGTTGDQYKILITVIDCIRAFVLSKENANDYVDEIEFSSKNYTFDENGNIKKLSRTPVYKRLVKKFLPPNFDMKLEDYGPTTYFTVYRK